MLTGADPPNGTRDFDRERRGNLRGTVLYGNDSVEIFARCLLSVRREAVSSAHLRDRFFAVPRGDYRYAVMPLQAGSTSRCKPYDP